MFDIINILAADPVAPWITASFKIIRVVLIAILILLSIALIVSILMQPAAQEGLGAISGSQDTFFSKNKGKSREGMLKRLSVIISISIFVVAMLYFGSLMIDQSQLGSAEALISGLF